MTAPNVIKAVVGEDSNGQNRASSPSSFVPPHLPDSAPLKF